MCFSFIGRKLCSQYDVLVLDIQFIISWLCIENILFLMKIQ